MPAGHGLFAATDVDGAAATHAPSFGVCPAGHRGPIEGEADATTVALLEGIGEAVGTGADAEAALLAAGRVVGRGADATGAATVGAGGACGSALHVDLVPSVTSIFPGVQTHLPAFQSIVPSMHVNESAAATVLVTSKDATPSTTPNAATPASLAHRLLGRIDSSRPTRLAASGRARGQPGRRGGVCRSAPAPRRSQPARGERDLAPAHQSGVPAPAGAEWAALDSSPHMPRAALDASATLRADPWEFASPISRRGRWAGSPRLAPSVRPHARRGWAVPGDGSGDREHKPAGPAPFPAPSRGHRDPDVRVSRRCPRVLQSPRPSDVRLRASRWPVSHAAAGLEGSVRESERRDHARRCRVSAHERARPATAGR
jgi:hypothetical protein